MTQAHSTSGVVTRVVSNVAARVVADVVTSAEAPMCPCQSGEHYQQCCGPLHEGGTAESVEQLMRSRFAAFVLGLEEYLRRSWHSETCPDNLTSDPGLAWAGLEIIASDQKDGVGHVAFKASFYQLGDQNESGGWHELQERSQFVMENNRWVYRQGEAHWSSLNPGRNESCPCGSGLKYKKCCQGKDSAFFRRARRAFQQHAPGHCHGAGNGDQ